MTSHDLIFNRWGLANGIRPGSRSPSISPDPSGTGKTICAEAIAHTLGRRLLVVRYAELESMWMGETPKNVAAVFRLARQEHAVLFFDEADAIASRRSTSIDHGFQRESNTVVNVLLQELERFDGVVIFATNLAANFDPAFERRIRTHVLFEMPGVDEREQIWRVQMHPTLTPLADDVNFRELAEKYEVSGGDIRNAVLKAALAAAVSRSARHAESDSPAPSRRRHQGRHRRQARDAAVALQTTRHSSVLAHSSTAWPPPRRRSPSTLWQWPAWLCSLRSLRCWWCSFADLDAEAQRRRDIQTRNTGHAQMPRHEIRSSGGQLK